MEERLINQASDKNEFPTKLNNLTSEVKNFNPSNKNLIKRTKDFKESKDLTDHNIISNSFSPKEKKWYEALKLILRAFRYALVLDLVKII